MATKSGVRRTGANRVGTVISRLVRVTAHLCVLAGYLLIAVAGLLLGWLFGASPLRLAQDPQTVRLLRVLLGSASVLGVAVWLWKGHAMLVRFAHRRIWAYLIRP
jgi:hypothetical protein